MPRRAATVLGTNDGSFAPDVRSEAAGVLVALVSFAMSNQKRSHDTQVVTTDAAGRQAVRESHVESNPPT